MKEQITAIVLAAGQGKRMQAEAPKQYLDLGGRPLLFYTLKAFEESFVDEVILVTAREEVSYCKKEIVDRYFFHKVKKVVPGGKERYHSVYEGLKAIENADYVLIHDGARPLVTQEIMARTLEAARTFRAAAAAMPVKDTIKIADEAGFVADTPNRSSLWMMQTPQTFFFPLILEAYTKLIEQEKNGHTVSVTDDAMVLETVFGGKIKLVEGSYENIKITTPSDLKIAGIFLKNTLDTKRQ